jgi:hypothetical protein
VQGIGNVDIDFPDWAGPGNEVIRLIHLRGPADIPVLGLPRGCGSAR